MVKFTRRHCLMAVIFIAASWPAPGVFAEETGRCAEGNAAGYGGKIFDYQEPSQWGGHCNSGRSRQSPIDLSLKEDLGRPNEDQEDPPSLIESPEPISISSIKNNGHTIQLTVTGGSMLKTKDGPLKLLQIHWHYNSEHTLEGRHFPLEMHLVHEGKDGHAVLGVFISEGEAGALNEVFDHLPECHNQEIVLNLKLPDILPAERTYFRYPGSLTTPDCNEGVTWLVLKTPLTMTKDRIRAFASLFPKTNRPTQKINDRKIEVINAGSEASMRLRRQADPRREEHRRKLLQAISPAPSAWP